MPPVHVLNNPLDWDTRIGEVGEFIHPGLGSLPEEQLIFDKEIRQHLTKPNSFNWDSQQIAEILIRSLKLEIALD